MNTLHTPFKATQKGYSLVEIIIAIAIASITTNIAISSFGTILEKNRTVASANDVILSLYLARSEAIKRRTQVSMVRNSTDEKVWEEGWVVFADQDGDGTLDADDTVIRRFSPITSGHTIRTGSNFKDWVAYLPTGFSKSGRGLGNDTFRVCPGSMDTSLSRKVVVNNVGRAKVLETAKQCP